MSTNDLAKLSQAGIFSINEHKNRPANLAIAARPFCHFRERTLHWIFVVANVFSSGLNAVLCGKVIL